MLHASLSQRKPLKRRLVCVTWDVVQFSSLILDVGLAVGRGHALERCVFRHSNNTMGYEAGVT